MIENPFAVQLNLATYTYACSALWIALFFKFARPFSLRNIDVLLLQVPAFGLLALAWRPAVGYALLLGWCIGVMARCLLDPALLRRPALGTNATPGALGFLAALAVFSSFVQLDRIHRTVVRPAGLEAEAQRSGREEVAPVRAVCTLSGPLAAPVERLLQLARSSAANLWLMRLVVMALHVLIALGVAQIGVRWFADRSMGIAMAAAYLLTPYPLWAGLNLHHVLPPVLLVWSVAFFDRPLAAACLLTILAVICDGLVFLLPLWAPVLFRYNRRQFWVGCVLGAALALTVAWITEMPVALAPSRLMAIYVGRFELTPEQGLWALFPGAFRLPVLAAYLSMLVLFMAWPLHKNLADLIAASAAAIAGMQWWYPLMGGTYVSWMLPLLLLLVFRPTLVRVKA